MSMNLCRTNIAIKAGRVYKFLFIWWRGGSHTAYLWTLTNKPPFPSGH